jgi:hypothetical protein
MTIMLPDFPFGNDPDYEYVPDPMGRLGRGTWRRRRKIDPFGRTEADWEFEAFRKEFDLKKPLGRIFRNRPLDLTQPVGRDAENDRFDVALVEALLAKNGAFDLDRTEGPTGHYGTALEDAIRTFQKSENLKVDGLINPGGPTLAALTARLARAEGAKNGEDGGDDDPEPAEREPVNLLELAMRRRKGPVPPAPGEILDDGGFPGGGSGGARGRKPVPPIPPVGSPDPARRPPVDSADEPDAEEARREALADEFVKEITKPLEAHRGNETTKKGNDIVARECKEILEKEFPDLLDKVEHVGGATRDGSGKERDKLSEIYLEKEGNKDRGLDPRQGSSHPDLTWEHENEGRETRAHANTVTTNKDGRTPTAQEQRSFDSLVEKVGAELATAIPKLRPGMDENDYRDMARKKCREIFGKLRDKLDKSGDEEPESDES